MAVGPIITGGLIYAPSEIILLGLSASGPVTHVTSGDLVGAGAAVVGTAARVGPTIHATSGALSGAGAVVAGVSAHVKIHATSGVLAGAGAVIVGVGALPVDPDPTPTPEQLAAEKALRRTVRRRTLRAASARDVNFMWRRIEPTDEKSPVYREQVPGLTEFADIGGGAFRGGWSTGSRAFVAVGATLYEVFTDGTYVSRGTLGTSVGPVDFAQGLLQLVLVDGTNGYVLTLASNAFAQISDADFLPASRVAFLDGKFVFVATGTQQFFWSEGIDSASTYDALDFASAESSPDLLVALLVDHRELILFGETTIEPWLPVASGDQVYQRNSGAIMETGCAATHSAQKIDNSFYWVGQDKNGRGMVFTAGGPNGYQPQRISTHDLEEALAKSTDLSAATAYCMQADGQTFYFLNAPGMDTTWVYDASVRRWHERAELVAGELQPWRANGSVFAYGKHLVGDDDGVIYELDPYEYTYAGDTLYRETTSPHSTSPGLRRVFFDSMTLNCTLGQTSSGEAPVVEMRYSDDGGETWGSWLARSTGRIGEFDEMPQWHRLGSARDRVWQIRITDDCKASIVAIDVKAKEGMQ